MLYVSGWKERYAKKVIEIHYYSDHGDERVRAFPAIPHRGGLAPDYRKMGHWQQRLFFALEEIALESAAEAADSRADERMEPWIP